MKRMCRAKFAAPIGTALAAAAVTMNPAWAQKPPVLRPVLTVRGAVSPASVAPGASVTLQLRLAIAPQYHVNANPASEAYLVPTTVSFLPSPGITAGKANYPEGRRKTFAFTEKPIAVYDGTVTVRVPMTVARDARTGARRLAGSVRYQACNHQNCLLPARSTFEVKLMVAKSASGKGASRSVAQSPAVGSLRSDAPESRLAEDSTPSTLQKRYQVRGLPAIVFLDGNGQERTDLRAGEDLTRETMLHKLDALKSGTALAASAESEAGWSKRLQSAPLWLQLGLVFLGGLLLNLTPCVYPMIPITVGYFGTQSQGRTSQTFTLAAVYVLGLALVYSTVGVVAALTGSLFGAAMQSPFVTGFVALVLFGLGLSMFGLFTLQPPRFLLERSGAKKGVWGALGMGALLGFVCAPCVGPVVAALLAYVGVQANPFLGFALFFALSLGLGLPYLLLGTFSGSLKALPKSGAWMEKAKKVFAVPLVLAALYYAFLTVQPALVSRQTNVQPNMHWPPATAVALAEARRSGQPVVLDFRADWCLPCKKLDRDVFSQRDVLSAARGIKLLQVDLTRANG